MSKTNTAKAQLADLLAQIAPKGKPQPNPIGCVLPIQQTGRMHQRIDNRDGSAYLLHEYAIKDGHPLARLQFEKDMESNGFDCHNPMDRSELVFKHRDLLYQSDVKQIIRNEQGFWTPDLRRSLLRKNLMKQGIFTPDQIEAELNRLLPEVSDESLDNIGE